MPGLLETAVKPCNDTLGGEEYQRDIDLSKRNGATPTEAQKVAFKMWEWRNFGNTDKISSTKRFLDI